MRKNFLGREARLIVARWSAIAAVTASLCAAMVIGARKIAFAQQSAAPAPQILLISEYDMAPGRAINDVVEEASGWVRDMRKTGEYNSVRLFVHSYGSGLRMWVLAEPKSWQAIKTGDDKFMAARPDIFTSPFRWVGHSDNILNEVPVR
jgi:hypothetical protein